MWDFSDSTQILTVGENLGLALDKVYVLSSESLEEPLINENYIERIMR